MSQTIVFVHGAWVTPRCWDPMKGFFEAADYTCLAPTWPHKDHPIGELRASLPAGLAHLGVTEIVDHYERIIRDLPSPPILIGQRLIRRCLGGVKRVFARGPGASEQRGRHEGKDAPARP